MRTPARKHITWLYPLSVGATLALAAAYAKAAEPAPGRLDLNSFLGQVRTGNQAVRGSEAIKSGTELRSKEGSLLFTPNLFGTAQSATSLPLAFISSGSGSLDPKLTNATYQLGISQNTPFGLQSRLYYNFTHNEVIPGNPPYYEGRPTLELTLSLWQNALGSQVRATEELLEANALASHYAESFRIKQAMTDAETNYWRLALARQNVTVQRDALERSQKIHEWNARRARLQLADQADLYQAAAAVDVRKLQLQSASDEERTAARSFNSSRGVDSDVVPEQIDSIDSDQLEHLNIPGREAQREDVKAAEQQERALIANAEVSREKNKPVLEVFGTVALNSRNNNSSDAFSKSWTTHDPTNAIGVRFQTPLAFGKLSDVREGYAQEKTGAELNYQRRLFDQEHDWKELVDQFSEAKRRLSLARSIEVAQLKKLNYERARLQRGRTTTYQVLLFEQDYATSQLSRIQAQAQVLQILAQMKLFGGA